MGLCSTRSLPKLVSSRPQALLLMSRVQVPTASPLRSMTLTLKISPLTTVLASWASSDPMLRAKSVWPCLYNDDITLQGPDSLEGAFIGFRCVESGTLVGACQLEVFEKGDHPDDEDDDDDE